MSAFDLEKAEPGDGVMWRLPEDGLGVGMFLASRSDGLVLVLKTKDGLITPELVRKEDLL